MSETLSLWPFETSSEVPVLFRPQMMIGAATPLWGYFTGAALTGVALWWMSRWMPTVAAAAGQHDRLAQAPAKLPALVVVEPVEEPILDAEFVEAAPSSRPRRSKPVEVKSH